MMEKKEKINALVYKFFSRLAPSDRDMRVQPMASTVGLAQIAAHGNGNAAHNVQSI